MKLLAFSDLRERGITYSRVHLWRLVQTGKFPAPIAASERRKFFIETEVDAWIRERMTERTGGWRPAEPRRRLTQLEDRTP